MKAHDRQEGCGEGICVTNLDILNCQIWISLFLNFVSNFSTFLIIFITEQDTISDTREMRERDEGGITTHGRYPKKYTNSWISPRQHTSMNRDTLPRPTQRKDCRSLTQCVIKLGDCCGKATREGDSSHVGERGIE